jgi:hypothetical protein
MLIRNKSIRRNLAQYQKNTQMLFLGAEMRNRGAEDFFKICRVKPKLYINYSAIYFSKTVSYFAGFC